MEQKVYSYDDYYWSKDYEEIRQYWEDSVEVGEPITLSVGDSHGYGHERFLTKWDIPELMQEQAYSEADEWSEGYLSDLTEKHCEQLLDLVCDFLNKNVKAPQFYTVINIEEQAGWWDGQDITFTPMMSKEEMENNT